MTGLLLFFIKCPNFDSFPTSKNFRLFSRLQAQFKGLSSKIYAELFQTLLNNLWSVGWGRDAVCVGLHVIKCYISVIFSFVGLSWEVAKCSTPKMS